MSNKVHFFNLLDNPKKNLISFSPYLLCFVIFCIPYIYSWKYAIPYCHADDWRQIKFILQPYFEGTFKFTDLWIDLLIFK